MLCYIINQLMPTVIIRPRLHASLHNYCYMVNSCTLSETDKETCFANLEQHVESVHGFEVISLTPAN
jgi:hypothetical protein